MSCCFFFFFKQKTAYEMRISDWSSDVCSSDLRVAIPVEPEPAHPVEDRVDRGLGGAGAVGILDAQQEIAAVVAREQPVEQRGARAADLEETRRRRREARDDAGIRPCAQLRSEEKTSELQSLIRHSNALF